MIMKTIILLACITTTAVAQFPATAVPPMTAPPAIADAGDDPGYAAYKEGYDLILDERWEEARKKLEAMIKQFPQSDYVDDAAYWSAFALRHIDSQKGTAAYEKFLKDYPKSNYYDDAVADLNQLKVDPFMVAPKVRARGGTSSYSWSYSTPGHAELSMREAERALRNVQRLRTPRAGAVLAPGRSMTLLSREMATAGRGEKLDPETELKIEALYALGNTKQDEKAFATLKDVALDFKAARPLRQAALDALVEFKKFDILPVYLVIAKQDTSEEMQNLAINFITSASKDRNKSVYTLIDLFNAVPKGRGDQRRTIFYCIADVGNDRAVDFLASIARTSDDYDLRREAVVYLGNIGSEKARAALFTILSGK